MGNWSLRKTLVKNITTEHRRLDHVWQWKELENGEVLTLKGYDAMMQASGHQAVLLQEQVAGIKGQLQARASRAKAKAKQ